jgi:hypothetical protein
MAKKDETAFVLTPGSVYKIKSLESRDHPMETIGTFKGYAAIAHDTALVIELEKVLGEEKSRLRLIPANMIMSIDVVKAEAQKEEKEGETNAVYFG